MSDHPYPGLRPFRREETDIFFGRENQTDSLTAILEQTHFLAVLGQSGSGKSSLVITGLLPALEGGFMGSARPNWAIAHMRPGNQPFSRLANALLDDLIFRKVYSGEEEVTAQSAGLLEAALQRGPLALNEILQLTPLPQNSQLLILVDQFEELFRYQNSGDEESTAKFVALLLEALANPKIYVSITMRSDYLGYCTAIHGLPEAINRGLFLTPLLTREEMADAIRLPARVFDGEVENALVNSLLNETGGEQDQLPLLQHALRRAWDLDEDKILTLPEYEDLGGLQRALSDHADDAYDALDPKQQRIAESMFRCLTERASDFHDTRRPKTVSEVAAVAAVSPEDVYRVVDVFRESDRCFLMPPAGVDLTPDKLLDISHESLIRQWSRLREWTIDEAEQGDIYRRVVGAARRWKESRGELWRGIDLQIALDWRDTNNPTPQWAQRYGGDLSLSLEFLQQSDAEDRQHKRDRGIAQRREIEQLRQVAKANRIRVLTLRAATGFFALVTIGLLAFLYLDVLEHTAYYHSFNKRWGIPEGQTPLSKSQRQRRTVSLKMTKSGRLNPVHTIEAVDSFGNCTTDHDIGTYFDYADGISADETPCRWEFVIDAGDNINYERAFAKNGRQLWVFDYSPISPRYIDSSNRPTVRRATMISQSEIDPGKVPPEREMGETRSANADTAREGTPASESLLASEARGAAPGAVSETGLDTSAAQSPGSTTPPILPQAPDTQDASGTQQNRAQLAYRARTAQFHYDDEGYAVRIDFLNRTGDRARGPDRQFSEKREYRNGRLVVILSVDRANALMNDQAGNAIVEISYSEHGFPDEYLGKDRNKNRTMLHSGWSRIVREHDKSGNVTVEEYYDAENHPILGSNGYHRQETAFDRHGNTIQERYFDEAGNPLQLSSGNFAIQQTFENESHRLSGTYYLDQHLQPMNNSSGYAAITYEYDDETAEMLEIAYRDTEGDLTLTSSDYAIVRYEYNEGRRTHSKYYGVNGRPIDVFGGYSQVVSTYDDLGREDMTRYIAANGEPGTTYGGIGETRYHYDARSNLVQTEYFGPDGERINNSSGYAIRRSGFDIYGNMTFEEYLDEDEQGVIAWDGYARVERQFDEYGNVVRSTYFDENGELTSHAYGYVSVIHDYDHDGNQTRSTYRDENDQPIMLDDGYAIYERDYDAMGHVTEIRYRNLASELIDVFDGYAVIKKQWDDKGKLIGESYLGADGKPASIDGYSSWASVYNAAGRKTSTRYFGLNGTPVTVRSNKYHGYIYEYDRRGRITSEYVIGTDSKPIADETGLALVITGYDSRGNKIDIAVYDSDRQLMRSIYGYARMTSAYDDRGYKTDEAYFDENDDPLTLDDVGCPRIGYTSDDNGNTTVERCLDPDGNLIAYSWSDDVAQIRSEFDGDNNLIQTASFDLSGQPEPVYYGGPQMIRYEHDEAGNVVRERFFDHFGDPFASNPTKVDGVDQTCAEWRYKHSDSGEVTDFECSD